jgi:hypothetical protein
MNPSELARLIPSREGGRASVFLQEVSQQNRTRATMKALPTSTPPPSPLRNVMGLFSG